MRRPLALWALMACTLFQGLSGTAGGIRLVLQRGEGGWLPIERLEGSPFSDYLIPGLVLFVVLGLYPLVVSVAQWRRAKLAWLGSVALGGALVVWILALVVGILVEIAVVGSEPGAMRVLQIVYGSLGVLILVLAMLPRVRQALSPPPPSSGRARCVPASTGTSLDRGVRSAEIRAIRRQGDPGPVAAVRAELQSKPRCQKQRRAAAGAPAAGTALGVRGT